MRFARTYTQCIRGIFCRLGENKEILKTYFLQIFMNAISGNCFSKLLIKGIRTHHTGNASLCKHGGVSTKIDYYLHYFCCQLYRSIHILLSTFSTPKAFGVWSVLRSPPEIICSKMRKEMSSVYVWPRTYQ